MMTWYFKVAGGHTHVRVFMNGGKCGDLCFRNHEFDSIRSRLDRGASIAFCESFIQFIDETPTEVA